MGRLVTVAQALRKIAKEPEPDYRDLPNEEGFTYPGAGGRGAHPSVQEAIEEFRNLPDTAKRDLPLLWYLLGEGGTPQYKMSKADSDYTDKSSYEANCDNCSFAYQRVVPDVLICSQVRGELKPEGWCRLWEPYPKEANVLTRRVASAQRGLRLLLADESWVTMTPPIIRKIERKIKGKGVESLSPREKKILQQLAEKNKATEEKTEEADVELVRGLRSKKKALEESIRNFEKSEPSKVEVEHDSPLDSPEEQEATARRDLKRVTQQLAEEEAKGVPEIESSQEPQRELSPEMKEKLEVAEKIRERAEQAGVEGTEKMSLDQIYELHQQSIAKDPLASKQPVKKTIGSLKLFKTRLRALSQRLPRDLQELSQQSEGGQHAAKQLAPIVKELLTPVDELTSRVERLESLMTSLDEEDSPEKLSDAHRQFSAIEEMYRGFGAQINESLGPLRNKHQAAYKNLKSVLDTRMSAALQQFQERGATPEQAAEMAQSHPTVRKLKAQANAMKSIAGGVDFILGEFGQRYAGALKIFKKLKTDLGQVYKQPRAAHVRSLARILASFYSKRTPQNQKISKRLRKVAKRLTVLRYLSITS